MSPKIHNVLNHPVWGGPERDGITQGLLSRFLVCRERFRLLMVDGLRPIDTFSHRIEYGQLWHVAEESLSRRVDWKLPVQNYAVDLCRKYPLSQDQIMHWLHVLLVQFPIYVAYWAKHPDVKDRTPLLQEQVFDVPYLLPSGRTVRLRGKWDSVDLIGKGKSAGVYLQENKTKGDIDEGQLKRQLQFDLQTGFYLVGLDTANTPPVATNLDVLHTTPLRGVRYNVVRRPLSGGKGSIVRRKGNSKRPEESADEFYARLSDTIAGKNPDSECRPEDFFMRWKSEVTVGDLERFKRQFLTPCLEQLCDWWGWITSPAGIKDPFADHVHYRMPFGVYSPLLDGGGTDLDEYLSSGSTLGLRQTTNLFPELE